MMPRRRSRGRDVVSDCVAWALITAIVVVIILISCALTTAAA